LEVDKSWTIKEIKDKIEEEQGYKSDEIKLFLGDLCLEPDEALVS
jgi:hypothetical protein